MTDDEKMVLKARRDARHALLIAAAALFIAVLALLR